MLGLGLDQCRRIDREHVILDGLAKDEREGIAITIPCRWRPSAFVALLQEPGLNVLAGDSFRWQLVEMLADNLELDLELMVMLGRVALFGIEFGLLSQFTERDGAAS